MATIDDIKNDVDTVIATPWNKRSGNKVPSSEDVALSGGAVELDATYLYTDLANSSMIAKQFDQRIAAKIFKTFHSTSCRLIRKHSGTILSFDGDRILAVFYGDSKNSSATKCALNINYVVTEVIREKFESKYEVVRNADFRISHGTGIDTGTVLLVRAGVRGSNDLVSIGRGPNLAAKLSELRAARTYITSSVYKKIHETSKFGGDPKENMWKRCSWGFLGDKIIVYRSDWQWEP